MTPPRPPSVDSLARRLSDAQNPNRLPHPLAVETAREAIATDRVAELETLSQERRRRMLSPVINATGVLLHTNLGRSPLGMDLAASYSNLELDLSTGKRGSRQQTVGATLATAAGAEAAMVVNNCASAVLLVLAALAAERGVAVSRGEMVEIGGGFRIPDVMRQSGAHLVEVGTTNRTRLSDYTGAIDERLAMVLKVHRSNYAVVGFTEEASVAGLAQACPPEIPVVVDLGSGLLDASCPWLSGRPPSWLADEPAVRQTLADGAALVMFSGDKLFGGPQAGIIAGRADLVAACGRHPLARALRPGSLVLHALQETALAYLDRRGTDIPLWAMASQTVEELQARAEAVVASVSTAGANTGLSAVPTLAVPGGGTLPTVTFPSFGLTATGDLTEALRRAEPPVIGRVEDGATVLDLRTVAAADDQAVAEALTIALSGTR